MTKLRSLARNLKRNTSGVAMVEFAIALPFFLGAVMGGTETANLAIVNMRVAQLATHLADNASRVGDTSTLENRKVYESDVNDFFYGAQVQSGRLDFFNHGRAVVSSLEVESAAAGAPQFIHWQRCKGVEAFDSAYGPEGTGLDGNLVGMGPAGEEVQALPDSAVIYVEVFYKYQPIISDIFAASDEITSSASFMVRDNRDLTGLYQRDEANPDPQATCDKNDGYP